MGGKGWLRVDRLLGEQGIPSRYRGWASGAGAPNREASCGRSRPHAVAGAQGALPGFRAIPPGAARGGEQPCGSQPLRSREAGQQSAEGRGHGEGRTAPREFDRRGFSSTGQRRGAKGGNCPTPAVGNHDEPEMDQWIAQRLQMGSWTYVSNLLNGRTPSGPQPAAPSQQLSLYQ